MNTLDRQRLAKVLGLTDSAHEGEALAAAQKQLFDQPETAHPFYWAAFVLVGDGGGLLNAAAPIKTASVAP